MEIKIVDSPSHMTIALGGKLDMDGVKQIEESFKKATEGKSSIVDMTNVEYLASLGIRIILQSAKAAAKNGHKMVIVNPRRNVLSVLQLANIDSVIPIVSSVEESARYI